MVRRAHSQPGVDLTYIKQSGESNGDAGDQYTGIDRFDRIVDQRWIKTSDGTHRDRFKYGYDRNSNRLYRTNELDHNFDELYHANGASNGYDLLDQLTDFRRGTLSDTNSDNIPDTVSSASRTQSWTIDAQGNFATVTTDSNGVNRTHNKQNQLTAVGSNNLAFDANGNETTDENGKTLVYDAWNRLVAYKNGSTVLVSNEYDALGRRIFEGPGTDVDFYFSADWQILEERVDGDPTIQYIWSPVYVDAMILRDRDADSNGSLEERLWVMHDANFNVTGLLNGSAVVQERYTYDPYGTFTIHDASWGSRSSSDFAWVHLHQGLRYNATIGAYDNFGRWYDPDTGRFLNVDPMRFAAGDTNFYRYVSNGPGNGLDPSGHDKLSLYWKTGKLLLRLGLESQLRPKPKPPPEKYPKLRLRDEPNPGNPYEGSYDNEVVGMIIDLGQCIGVGICVELGGEPFDPDWQSNLAKGAPDPNDLDANLRYLREKECELAAEADRRLAVRSAMGAAGRGKGPKRVTGRELAKRRAECLRPWLLAVAPNGAPKTLSLSNYPDQWCDFPGNGHFSLQGQLPNGRAFQVA